MPQCCYLAKGAKRPSHTTNMQTLSNKSSFYILAVTTLKASNLNSAVWDQIFIFCCMNRPHHYFHCKEALQLAAFWHLAYLFLTAHASTRANSISKDAFTMVPVPTVLFIFCLKVISIKTRLELVRL